MGRPQATSMSKVVTEVEKCYADPLRFVKIAYPWGQKGTMLEHEEGPEPWQTRFLERLGAEVKRRKFNGRDSVPAVRMSVSSGHGIGKSAMTAWIIHWLMSTRPHCRGTVTATTVTQLKNRTWSELARWTNLLICKDWFTYHNSHTNMSFSQVANVNTWSAVAQTCREENSEAFAGQHATSSSSFYVVDEASGVPDKIYEVMEGGLTDGEPFILLFGNPTKNTGYFFETHNLRRSQWITMQVDSREVSRTNKEQIREWINTFGEDSDFVRVRVKGVFPKRASNQMIGNEVVNAAMKRVLPVTEYSYAAKILGVDIARYGDDDSAVIRRQGYQVSELQRFSGLQTMEMAGVVVREIELWKPDAVFVDDIGIGSGVVDRLNELGHPAIGVNSGARPSDPAYLNKRAEIWGLMAEWMERASLPDDVRLSEDLTGPTFTYQSGGSIVLESKEQMRKRGIASPDTADALAFTFAYPVMTQHDTLCSGHTRNVKRLCETAYDLWSPRR